MDPLSFIIGLAGLGLGAYTVRQTASLAREQRAAASRERAEDLARARRERSIDRSRDALAAVLAESMHLNFLAGLEREHPGTVTIPGLFAAFERATAAFGQVSLLEPDLRGVVGDLLIAASHLVSATAAKDKRWRWPDVQTVFDDALRLYQEVVAQRLAE